MFRFILQELANRSTTNGIGRDALQEILRTATHPSQEQLQSQCPICLETYETDSSVVTLECSHHFHSRCIATWFEAHSTCPVCRHDERSEDEDNNVTFNISPEMLMSVNGSLSLVFIYPHGVRQTTMWYRSNTLIEVFQFLLRSCSHRNSNLQLKIGESVFKTSESFNILNRTLGELQLPFECVAQVSFF